MTTEVPEPDRDPRHWKADDQLAAIAAAAKPNHIIGHFVTTEGKKMAVIVAGRWQLSGGLDATDFVMSSQGWDQLNRLIAFGEDDMRAYAVWELYSRGEETSFRSKAIDVDCDHYKQGIGTGMLRVLVAQGWSIAPSGSATKAGRAFIRSWSYSSSATVTTDDEGTEPDVIDTIPAKQ